MLKKPLANISNKKIFITGGAGFIGSHVVERLVNENQITIYDNLRRNALQSTVLTSHPNIRLIQGDVLDFVILTKVMQNYDYVIHLAAIAGVSSYEKNPLKTLEVDAFGTYNILKAANENKIQHTIISSSSEVYGPLAANVNETANTIQGPATENRWSYGVGKLIGDHFAFAFSKMTGLNITVIRPFNIYGPRQVGEGAIQTFITNSLSNKPLMIRGDGGQIRAWCHISDCVEGILQSLGNKKAYNQIFNIGNPRAKISVKDLAQKIITLTNSQSKLIFQKFGEFTEIFTRSPDIKKSRTILGYVPKISLDKGLKNTIKWFK